MTSQYAAPLLIHENGTSERLQRLPLSGGRDAKSKYDEAWLTELLFKHPELLPIREIDSVYANPTPVCTELLTRVGLIDVLYVTSSGRLVIAEAKLWRNPEARRKVVGQILDYAAELARWTYSDLEREVAKRRGPGELFSVAAAADHSSAWSCGSRTARACRGRYPGGVGRPPTRTERAREGAARFLD